MRFQFLTGDINWLTYGGKFISNRLNNGDWNYWLVLSIYNLHEQDEDGPTYRVELSAVSPDAAGDNLNAALECCGFPAELVLNDALKVEALSDYGTAALLWYDEGNNYKQLFKATHAEARQIEAWVGFYLW